MLGRLNVDAGIVWWFGSGIARGGEPGAVLRFTYLGAQ